MFILCLKSLTSKSVNLPADANTQKMYWHTLTHTLIKHDDTLCGHSNARTCSHESKDCSDTLFPLPSPPPPPPPPLPSSTLNESMVLRMSPQKSCRSGEKCEWAEGESDRWAASVALAAVSRPSRNWSHMPAVWSLVYRLKTLPLLPYWSRRHKDTRNLLHMKSNKDNQEWMIEVKAGQIGHITIYLIIMNFLE